MGLHYVPDLIYDAGPTACRELMKNLSLTIKEITRGQIIEVASIDESARKEIPTWCRTQKHTLLDRKDFGETSYYYIQHG